jgi:hypothetical protein
MKIQFTRHWMATLQCARPAAASRSVIDLYEYQWRSHCRGLYQRCALEVLKATWRYEHV